MKVGEKLISFSVLESTNKYAISNIDKLPSGSVVWALEQTGGYGRFKRRWISPKGGLWFSVVFKPRLLRDPNLYTKVISVAVVETLQRIGCPAKIKWPNDIVVSDRKLAGILTEVIFKGTRIAGIVAGIGLNVNNDLPEELKETGISLKDVIGKEMEVSLLLAILLKKIDALRSRYVMKKKSGYLTRRWKKHLAYREGDVVAVSLNSGMKIKGTILKIASDYMTIMDERGDVHKIRSGEFIS